MLDPADKSRYADYTGCGEEPGTCASVKHQEVPYADDEDRILRFPACLGLARRARPRSSGTSRRAPYPLGELRSRLGELPRDQIIGVICRSGQRAYYATRILLQHGFDARTVAGGMLSHAQFAGKN